MDIFFKIQSKKTQFILSFISAVIYQIGFEIIMASGSFTVYFLSYIHYNQDWVDMNYGNLMHPVVLLFLAIFSPLSGTMEHFFGQRISLLISSIVIETAFVLLYFQQNLWYFYSLTLLLGIGSGLSTQILIKNSCYYYPKRKGLISALVASIGGLFGSGYSFLGEKVINPNREQIIHPKFQPYYEKRIAERSKLFFLFAMILIPISTSISIFLLYKYNPNSISTEIDEKIVENENNIQGPLIPNTIEGENPNNQNQDKDNPNPKVPDSISKTIKKALKKWRFWRNILLVGLIPFTIWFISSTSRPYSSLLGVDGKVIGVLAGSMNILGCITNPIWAFSVDKLGFKPIMITISSSTIALSIYFFVFMNNKLFYVIGLFLSCVLRGGFISSLVPHFMQIFGLKYFLTLGGLGRLFTQVFSFGAASVSIIISIFYSKQEELVLPYRIVMLCGASCSIFGLILSFFENDDKFKFEDEENEDKEKINNEDKEKGEIKEDEE